MTQIEAVYNSERDNKNKYYCTFLQLIDIESNIYACHDIYQYQICINIMVFPIKPFYQQKQGTRCQRSCLLQGCRKIRKDVYISYHDLSPDQRESRNRR